MNITITSIKGKAQSNIPEIIPAICEGLSLILFFLRLRPIIKRLMMSITTTKQNGAVIIQAKTITSGTKKPPAAEDIPESA